MNNTPVPIDVKKELYKVNKTNTYKTSTFFNPTLQGSKSAFFHPHLVTENSYGNLKTADGSYNREVDCRTLRRVSKKAWIINLCISSVQKKIKPFLKPSTNKNLRGFVIHKKGEDIIQACSSKSKEKEQIENFLLNTGLEQDSERDNFSRFCLKIIRDILEIDQVATEIAFTRAGKPYAFFAIDGATIEKVLPGQDNPENIKYVQVIDSIAQTFYPEDSLIFDFQNSRTDIYRSFYGYSYVEQAIDLITSQINTFNYNSGFFTENKLPRGMLLLNGNADQESVDLMEDYLCDIMSGGSQNQWRIPIIPAGSGKSGDNANSINWVNLSGTNREMEFQSWLDFLISGIVALFGCSVDELGLQMSKAQPMFEHNVSSEISFSKSQILGEMLSFLQQYINRILAKVYPEWELEFVGYEKEDPKAMLDITKEELETFKTLNEVRKEKGLPAIEDDWANKCPANPQFTQMYQASKANEQQDGGGMEDVGDMEENDFEENADSNAWEEVENNSNSTQESKTDLKNVEKSLTKTKEDKQQFFNV